MQNFQHIFICNLPWLNKSQQKCFVSYDSLLKTKLHKQVAIGWWQSQRYISRVLLISLLNIIVDEECLNKKHFNGLKIRKWVILILGTVCSVRRVILLLGNAFVIFTGAFFEEYLAKNFLLLFIRVIVLDIVVAGGIEHRIIVVIAIRISVPNFLVHGISLLLILWACHWEPININLTWLILYLRCQKEYPFVESAYNWDFNSLLSISSSWTGSCNCVALTLLFRCLLRWSRISCGHCPCSWGCSHRNFLGIHHGWLARRTVLWSSGSHILRMDIFCPLGIFFKLWIL